METLTRRLPVNGLELAWGQWGPPGGTPLVLCHGYTGGAHDFILQVDELSHGRQVIGLDQRGHGLSTKTHDASSYSVAQLVDDLVGFIEGTAGQPVDLLGHSMGGRVTLGVVLARPDLVRSLVLMDTSAWSFKPEDDGLRALVAQFMTEFDPTRGVPSRMSLGGPEEALIEAATPVEWRQRKDELYAGMDPYALKALGSELLADGVVSLRSRLAEVSCPVMVLAGSNDHPFIDQAPELAAEFSRGRLAVIEGAYHSPQLTHPEEWRGALEQHLAGVGA